MARRRRAVLALGALAAMTAHCAAISFDEAGHSSLIDTVNDLEDAATDTANAIVSALTGGLSTATESPSASVSVTPGSTSSGQKDIETAAASDADEAVSGDSNVIADSKTTAPTTAVTVSVSEDGSEEKTAPASATATSGVPTHAVSMTKRPATHSGEETGAESTPYSRTEASTSTLAPALTTRSPTTLLSRAPVTVVVATQAPVTESVATQAPVTESVATEAPAVAVPTLTPAVTEVTTIIAFTTAPPAAPATQAPAVADTPTPTTQSSSLSGAVPESGVVNDETEAPAVAGSMSADAAVITPDESTVVPLATTGAPATGTGSSDTSDPIPSVGETTAPGGSSTLPSSFASSGSNDTVTASSESDAEGYSDGTSPGQVHASSSAAVSNDGSGELDEESSDSSKSRGGHKKTEKKKRGTNAGSGSGGSQRESSTSSSKEESTSTSTSNSRCSGDGSSGMGALLNPGGVSDVNTSSATYLSLGAGSIAAIVGVIAGIMGLLVLFVAISRKNYAEDDDGSPLPYGYNMDIRSVPRLSPTFMQDDSFMESGRYNGTSLMVAMPPPSQFDAASSTSGESSDEVPSLRCNMMAATHCDPMADVSLRSRVPSVRSFSGDWDTGNVRMSALYSGGSSMTSGSAISGSWSSVLASDTERRTSRNTRDTSLSAWSVANLSSFGSTASGSSGLYRLTRSSSTLSGDLRHTGGSDRSRAASTSLMNQSVPSRPAAGAVESNRSNKSTEV